MPIWSFKITRLLPLAFVLATEIPARWRSSKPEKKRNRDKTIRIQEWERCPANQECRIDAKYCADDMSFPSVSRRERFRTPKWICSIERTIGCLFSSKDEVTSQQVFNFRSIMRQLGRRSTTLWPRWRFTNSERIHRSELIIRLSIL